MTMLSSAFRSRRVLLTGHTGFKGSWLALWLAEMGAKVHGYALPPGTNPSLFQLAKVESSLHHLEGDVRDEEHLFWVFKKVQPEIVFHLAAQPLVRRSYQQPKETMDINIGGTVNVLEAIRQTPSVKSAVIVTSDKCYENKEWIWGYRENDSMGGRDPYSASKGAAEIVTSAYVHSYFTPGVWKHPVGVSSARAGNVIGGGDFADDRLIPDAIRSILAGGTLEVRNPRSIRPWQHVLDPLGGYLRLAARLLESPAKFCGPWNFGPSYPEQLTVEALLTQFFRTMGTGDWRDVSAGSLDGLHEARSLWLCSDKAMSVLGWRPALSIAETIAMTAYWYQKVMLAGGNARDACLADIRRRATLGEAGEPAPLLLLPVKGNDEVNCIGS